MPVIHNPRHEAFCQNLANGMSQYDSYITAGYGESSTTASCASQLAAKPQIRARVGELLEEKREAMRQANASDPTATPTATITREWLIEQAKENLRISQITTNVGAANKAIELMAELMGFTTKNAPATAPDANKPKVPTIDPSAFARALENAPQATTDAASEA